MIRDGDVKESLADMHDQYIFFSAVKVPPSVVSETSQHLLFMVNATSGCRPDRWTFPTVGLSKELEL
jgi:hypothetical protein